MIQVEKGLVAKAFEDGDIGSALLLKVRAIKNNDPKLKDSLDKLARQKIEEIRVKIEEYRRPMTEELDLWACLKAPRVTRCTREAIEDLLITNPPLDQPPLRPHIDVYTAH